MSLKRFWNKSAGGQPVGKMFLSFVVGVLLAALFMSRPASATLLPGAHFILPHTVKAQGAYIDDLGLSERNGFWLCPKVY